MSRLVQIDPEAKLNLEPEGYEFGYHAFEDMEPIKSDIQEIKVSTEKEPITLPQEEIKLPLSNEKLLALQARDQFCNDISNKLQQGQLQNKNPYYKEYEVLKRYVEDGKQRFEVVVLPQVLSGAALQLAHEGLGHSGSPRTYALLNYNWYGMMGKLRAALLWHGWMEERINSYDRANHLTVSLDHKVENPDVPAPNDPE